MESFIQDFFSIGYCEAILRLFIDSHVSEPFNEGYVHLVYSTKITLGLRKIADYRYITSFEFGLHSVLLRKLSETMFGNQDIVEAFFPVESTPTYEETMECYRALEFGNNFNGNEKSVSSIKLSGVVTFLFVCFCMIILSFVIIFIERFIPYFVAVLKNGS